MGVHVHPSPTSKKVQLRNFQKRKESSTQICRQERMHFPLRYDKIKTKMVRKKEEKNKMKGINERKKEDGRLLKIEIIK